MPDNKAIATAPDVVTQVVALSGAEQTARDAEVSAWAADSDNRLIAQYNKIIEDNLKATDFTQLPDTALITGDVTACATYRQALRDLNLDAGWPTITVWPTIPAIISTKVQDKP